MRTSFQFESAGFLLLLGYIAFIPSGPFPISVAAGLNLDGTIGLLLCAFALFHISQIRHYPSVFVKSWKIYFFIVFVSATLSENIEYSIRYAFVMFGYSVVSLLIPVIYRYRVNTIRLWLFLIATLVSVLVIYLYFVIGVGQEHRFMLGAVDMDRRVANKLGYATVDPNMTAAGLILSLIIYFPNMFLNRKWIILEISGASCILIACLITLSRSAILGFLLAATFSFLVVFIKSKRENNFSLKNKKVFVSFVASLAIFSITVTLGGVVMPDVIDGLVHRLANSANDSSRIYLLIDAWDTFSKNPKTLLIGSGFMTTNPHNEYMRALSTMGFVGVSGSIIFLFVMFYISINRFFCNNRYLFSGLSIIGFVLVVSMFYGYTKLIWVAWMFLLFLYCESRDTVKSFDDYPSPAKYRGKNLELVS